MNANTTLIIHQEIVRAKDKHPDFVIGSDTDRSASILGEEYGEVCRAGLEVNRARTNESTQYAIIGKEQKLYAELSQVAATCILWMERLEYQWKKLKQEAEDAKQRENSNKTDTGN